MRAEREGEGRRKRENHIPNSSASAHQWARVLGRDLIGDLGECRHVSGDPSSEAALVVVRGSEFLLVETVNVLA
jgi:hypothetical protein